MRKKSHKAGFTLIELSIVLVIIGLLVGGVLVGRDLIASAAIRAQITQIQKYQQAVNTFRGKYASLPGDISDADATRFGLLSRLGYSGSVVSNDGMISSYLCNGLNYEAYLFWKDLATVKLIDDYILTGSVGACNDFMESDIDVWVPVTKIRKGHVSIYNFSGANYFGISRLTAVDSSGSITVQANLTAKEAKSIDEKSDDGIPNAGTILGSTPLLNANNPTDTSLNCWNSTTNKYSIFNNGAGVNCSLSIKLQ